MEFIIKGIFTTVGLLSVYFLSLVIICIYYMGHKYPSMWVRFKMHAIPIMNTIIFATLTWYSVWN